MGIQPEPYSPENLSDAGCKKACEDRNGCVAIVRNDEGKCYLRSHIKLKECVADEEWTLHVRPGVDIGGGEPFLW